MRQAGCRANLKLGASIRLQCLLTALCSETRPNAKPETVGAPFKKMRKLLTIILILSYFSGFSQKQLTLIIDTIDFVDELDQYDFKITLTNQGFANLGQTDSTAKVSTIDYPNFQTTVILKSDSTHIHIPLDQQNGYLELSNVYDSDTIRINKLKLFSNCYKDTTKTRIEHYRVKNDSVSDRPYKVKFKKKTEKKKCKIRPPFKTMLTINDQKYFVSIQKIKSDAVEYMHGHGYKPRQTEKNYENYSGTRLYISSITERYINVITVKIK